MRPLLIICAITSFILLFLVLLMPNKKAEPQQHQQDPIASPISPIKPSEYLFGNNVQWTDFQPLKRLSDASWGDFLTDIENHVPESMGTHYRDSDKITWAHESSHGIHSYLNNTHTNQGKIYGFYVGHNKAAILKQPNITLEQIANTIPEQHRKTRYNLYMVHQRQYFQNDGLYPFDEWIAYINGAEVGVELTEKNMLNKSKSDYLWALVEFDVYALYVCMTTAKYDPSFDNKQLLEFTAYNIKRSMDVYKRGMKYENLNWDDNAYLQELQTSPSSKNLRDYVIKTFGANWAKEVMGFNY